MTGRKRIKAAGVSLIELMIALLIGTLLVLGLVEVFAASRTAYQISEGLARVQENSRFAIDYLQRDLRMGGHFGCVNDQSHLLAGDELVSHFENVDGPLQFNVSVQGYEADDTKPTNVVTLPVGAGDWTPALPDHIAELNPSPGSDIVILRFLSSEGVPINAFNAAPGTTTITVDPARWKTLTNNGVADPRLFGIADCRHVDIFEAATNPATGTLVVKPEGLNKVDFLTDHYTTSPPGQAALYRAESLVYFIAPSGGDATVQSLYRARFNSSGGKVEVIREELVQGVENMQLLYGLDNAAATNATPTGYIGSQVPADEVIADDWRYVGLVRVGILVKSPNPAAAQGPGTNDDARPNTLGVIFAPPVPYDGNYRTTYESTVALRNRLYGN